ncbi:hypothetical protein [Crenothrix sp.]|uniref:hypothetical protein n=1 Tax=Crenothrix sp. TaxID=3100433 RepID=UPI00374D5D4B
MYLDHLRAVNKNGAFTKAKIMLGMVATLTLSAALTSNACADAIIKPPILEKLQQQRKPLAPETIKWMARWKGVDLEKPAFKLDELSGSTSVYLKVRKPDATEKDGYKAYGTFLSRSNSANPYSELAYFNLAAILGYDGIFRPTVRYALGSRARQAFKTLLNNTAIPPGNRLENKKRVLRDIATGKPLNGCLKSKKLDTNIAYDAIADIKAGLPRKTNSIIKALQAASPQPSVSQKFEPVTGYKSNMLQLAREYSIIMTLDTIFQQWDRYSGANVVLAKDKAGIAHFYSTDNGGANLEKSPAKVLNNLKYFSRYDRKTITRLKALYGFLVNPAKGFLGYKNAEAFVVDLGLYGELKPAEYVALLKRNIGLLLNQVAIVEKKLSNKAYLP